MAFFETGKKQRQHIRCLSPVSPPNIRLIQFSTVSVFCQEESNRSSILAIPGYIEKRPLVKFRCCTRHKKVLYFCIQKSTWHASWQSWRQPEMRKESKEKMLTSFVRPTNSGEEG
jgi:hypothetical protein